MKPCALCRQPALLFCESDRASLCWDCDAKVHGANFLVARHSRCLLCRACQEPTPWKASGSQLGRTVSVCDACANGNCQAEKERPGPAVVAASVREATEMGRMAPVAAAEVREERGRSSGDEEDEDDGNLDREDGEDSTDDDDEGMGTDYDDEEEMRSDYDDDDDDEDEEEDSPFEDHRGVDDEEDGENQVVPWSTFTDDATAAPPPPPPTASSSSSDDADYYHEYESSASGRRMPMLYADDNDDIDGGFAKRRMLARGNAADLGPSYHYQVC